MTRDVDEAHALAAVSTGRLPGFDQVEDLLRAAYARYAPLTDGTVADYIPALASADPALFGLSVVDVDGSVHAVGDADHEFSIQSISKAFVYALALEEHGHDAVRAAVGVNATGLPFNSVMAVELNAGSPMNPMVNAGAIAVTALLPGGSPAARWQYLRDGLSAFAGRRLELDVEVYESEAATNHRNRAIARLLESYGRLARDPLETTDLYTQQCALRVSARDLAVMGATLADGGVNPVTHERVVDASVCRHVLAALAASGLYERSGEWLDDVGMPGKSGVAGGIVTIAPGKGGLGTYSAPLDPAGNSVRGVRATRYLSAELGLNLFASRPDASHDRKDAR